MTWGRIGRWGVQVRRQAARVLRAIMDRASGSVLDRVWTRRLARRFFSGVYPARWETVTVGGVLARFWIADRVAERYVRGHEHKAQAWLVEASSSPVRALDAGAHHGYWTILMALLVGARGRVVAVEPEARNREILERNLVENGVRDRVEILEGSVQEAGLSGGFDLAKADVEGDEAEALASGAVDLTGCQAAVVEIHPAKLRARGMARGTIEALLADQEVRVVGRAFCTPGPYHVFAKGVRG